MRTVLYLLLPWAAWFFTDRSNTALTVYYGMAAFFAGMATFAVYLTDRYHPSRHDLLLMFLVSLAATLLIPGGPTRPWPLP